MAIFTVHAPPGAIDAAAAAEDAVFLREGFSPAAFVFAPLWAILRGAWSGLVIWIVAIVVVGLAAARLGDAAGLTLYLGVALWFGLEARNLRRWHLARRGWQMVGLAAGANRREAEARFVAKLAADTGETSLPPLPPTRTLPRSRSSAFPPVVGYLPGDTP